MNILPNADRAVIPIEKFTEYSLNPQKQKDKSIAFERAMGYNLSNVQKLIDNIRANITNFAAVPKPDLGYGQRYQVVMELTGENGKRAKVLTSWIFNSGSKIPRLTSVYVDK
jgi:prephenate dehydratase